MEPRRVESTSLVDRSGPGIRFMKPIRIEVVGKDESSNPQARTYAKYRLVAALARYRQRVRGGRIVLRRGKRNGTCDTVVCAAIVALEPSGTVRAYARERHAYAAINRAVEHIGDLMRRRSERSLLNTDIEGFLPKSRAADLPPKWTAEIVSRPQ